VPHDALTPVGQGGLFGHFEEVDQLPLCQSRLHDKLRFVEVQASSPPDQVVQLGVSVSNCPIWPAPIRVITH